MSWVVISRKRKKGIQTGHSHSKYRGGLGKEEQGLIHRETAVDTPSSSCQTLSDPVQPQGPERQISFYIKVGSFMPRHRVAIFALWCLGGGHYCR